MATLSHEDWIEEATKVRPLSEAFIGGKFVPAQTGETFASINPATGQTLANVAACGDKDVDTAVDAARKSFESRVWSGMGATERKAVLLRFADLMEQHSKELAVLDSLDMGKRVVDAYDVDLSFSISLFRYYAEALDKISDEVAPTPPGTVSLVRKVPVGVVGAVIPWNYPVDMVAWKVAPALAVGNSVVLKPAEESPLSALRLAELAAEAGMPDGVFNVVPGLGEVTGRALGLHPNVDCIAFTGSTEVGRLFQRYASDSNMKQVWLECGGKSPNIVFADTDDLKVAAQQTAFDICFNQGEVCSAHSRLLVQRSVQDELVSLIGDYVEQYQPGDPLDPNSGMGALVTPEHTAKVMSYVEQAPSTAERVCGGQQPTIGNSDCYVQPTVFNNVDPRSPLAQEEVFGPVLAVTGFDTEDEATALANDSRYGLAASVSTGSLSRAHRVADQLVAGTVSVNAVDAFSAWTPFGGFKASGYGRDLSLHAMDKFTDLKTTWIAT